MQREDASPSIACGGGPIDEKAVSVWDEDRQMNVCGLCGSSDLTAGYGLGGGPEHAAAFLVKGETDGNN